MLHLVINVIDICLQGPGEQSWRMQVSNVYNAGGEGGESFKVEYHQQGCIVHDHQVETDQQLNIENQTNLLEM